MLALGAGPSGASPAAKPGLGKKLARALDRLAAAQSGPPGVLVLLRTGGGRIFATRGTANTKTGRAPAVDDHMRIASVSKAYSGAVALALAERGKLSLDDTIGEWLPGVLPKADAVTVAELLQHTGGVPEYIETDEFRHALQRDPKAYLSPEEVVSFVRDEPLDFTPGAKYRYSDTDNNVVGLIAERASGRSYGSLLRRFALRPIGATDTSLPRTVRMPKPFLHGYDIEPGGPPDDVSELVNPAGAWASGGIVSTPNELGRFMRAYVGARLFGRATRRLQHSFVEGSSSPPGPGQNSAGLGVFRYRTGCGTVFGHTGSFPGYRMFAASSRDGRRSVVFATSSQIVPGMGSPEVSDLTRRAQRLAVCRILGD